MSPFIQLLNIALGNMKALDAPLSEDQWTQVCDMAKKQAVVGLVYNAMLVLPQDQKAPRKSKVVLALMAEKIAQKNAILNAAIPEIVQAWQSRGVSSCLLKGQGLALLYPDPMCRQCGDIDLWVDAKCDEILEKVPGEWTTKDVWYHHVDVQLPSHMVNLEVHMRPSWMNSPFNNNRLQAYFEAEKSRQMSNFNETLGCCTPTADFNLVYNMIHLYRHILFEGIGLRQFVDYFYVLKNSSASQRAKAMEQLRSLGIGGFVPAVMHVLKTLFMLPDEYLLTAPDVSKGEFLVDEIYMSGNFGQTDPRNKWSGSQNYIGKGIHRMKHLSRFIGFAFSEVVWAPYFKIRQVIWKRLNHYR